MTIQTLTQNSRNAEPAGAAESMAQPLNHPSKGGLRAARPRRATLGSRRTFSGLIGALFLLGFVTYGVGFGLVTSIIGTPDFLSTLPAHHITLVLGAFLMLLNSAVDVGKAVLIYPILEKHGQRGSLAYFATMIFEVVLLAVGALCLLMLIPLAQQSIDTGMASAGWIKALGALAIQSNTMAYQIAQMSLGFGCLFLCALLFQTRLIPRPLALWGLIGYTIHMAGAIAEIFGIHISLILLIPAGLFELALGFWLIFKGFQPEAYGPLC